MPPKPKPGEKVKSAGKRQPRERRKRQATFWSLGKGKGRRENVGSFRRFLGFGKEGKQRLLAVDRGGRLSFKWGKEDLEVRLRKPKGGSETVAVMEYGKALVVVNPNTFDVFRIIPKEELKQGKDRF